MITRARERNLRFKTKLLQKLQNFCEVRPWVYLIVFCFGLTPGSTQGNCFLLRFMFAWIFWGDYENTGKAIDLPTEPSLQHQNFNTSFICSLPLDACRRSIYVLCFGERGNNDFEGSPLREHHTHSLFCNLSWVVFSWRRNRA